MYMTLSEPRIPSSSVPAATAWLQWNRTGGGGGSAAAAGGKGNEMRDSKTVIHQMCPEFACAILVLPAASYFA